jgi:protein TonB
MRRVFLVGVTFLTLFLAIAGFSHTTMGAAQVARPGVNGVTVPACTYCPLPEYTHQARKARIQGTVVVQALVTVDGRAENVSVTKGLAPGLDEKAIEAVKKWRFRPAQDANGHAVAVTVPMEVTFRLT